MISMARPSRQALKCKANNGLAVRGQAGWHTAAAYGKTVARHMKAVALKAGRTVGASLTFLDN